VQADKAFLVRQIPLFGSLDGDEIGFLGDLLHEVSITAGVLLLREGDPGDRFYILVDGEAEVIKALGTPDERIIGVRRAGEFFGEMSLLEAEGLRMASVRARTPPPAGDGPGRL